MATVPLHRRLQLIALRPDTTRAEVQRLAAEARRLGILALAVSGSRVELAADLLAESPVKVTGLVGFPFGTAEADVKRFEAEAAVEAGAQELAAVLNPGWLKDGNDRAVLRELRDLREAAEERPVTAILELSLLTLDEARRAARLTLEAEVQFLATATGCAARPTSVADLQALREAVGPDLGLTAVGGVLGPADADALVAAGANRLGVFDLAPFVTPSADDDR